MSTQGNRVYSAINAVAEELSKTGIAKTRKNQQQGFMFRGIDEIYANLSPLLAKHKLCILPRVMQREVQVRETHSGSALYSVAVHVQFDFVSAEDGSIHMLSTFGEAMDTGDKATNKAMSAAYKYVCLQAFCIPLEGDNDADAFTPEETKARAQKEAAKTQVMEAPEGLDIFQKNITEAAAKGTEAYRVAWEAGTPAQRKASAGIHAELKEMAKIKDTMGAGAK